ncbi:tetratricopeptide repeat protein [Prolixibacteraceae bacterium Z1-6]|uniref:Tetratricopeptide repeat protein n=1 Tax=Draconibacterium aestuarii TaxID=2998507 RepID=A0A9X3J9C7_9BACT|nr:tetratricopeptide repeat protein [Prolixibacteraceae bacterium Z1-6]
MDSNLPGKLAITYPFDGAVFPSEFPEPSILWTDHNRKSKQWLVLLKTDSLDLYSEVVNSNRWKPTPEIWNNLKRVAKSKNIEIRVAGIDPDEKNKLQSGISVQITISKDSVNSPIFYRAVPLPFKYATSHLDSIKYMLGDISSTANPKPLLENLPVCGNCHSFSPDGKQFAMDVDAFGDKGSYLIANVEKKVEMSPEKFITWSDFQEKSTMALLSQISPNGKYVLSTLDDNEIFESRDHPEYSQLFFPIKGILALYDIEKKEFKALRGADDTMFVQSNSHWAPDNKTIYFARSKAIQRKESGMTFGTGIYDINKFQAVRDSFLKGKKHFKFDLMKLAFNNGAGGKPEYIPGASQNDKSNYFPKISPDGRWMIFCQAEDYMLLQPDSKLYIMPTDGSAVPRVMNCNTNNMNSWHSWSPNGKWIVFSSKYFGAYTQLFLAHVDENGMDAPPVWLEYFYVNNRAANIPEFVNIDFQSWDKISDNFSQVADYNVRGTSKAQFGDFQGAINDFNKALQVKANDDQAYANRGKAKDELNDLEGALADLNRAIELDPLNHDYYIHRGNTKIKLNDFTGAINDCSSAIALNPKDETLYAHRSSVYRKVNQLGKALHDISTAIKLKPEYTLYYVHKSAILNLMDRRSDAIYEMNKALRIEPGNIQHLTITGQYYFQDNQPLKAVAAFKKAIDLNPEYFKAYKELASFYDQRNNFDEALRNYNSAIKYCEKEDLNELTILYNNRGTLFGKHNQFEKAINDFNQALSYSPNFTDAYSNRAFAWFNSGKYDDALNDCNLALQIEPNFQKAKVIREMILEKR